MTLFLAVLVLLAGLLAGCGGGDQAENGSQNDSPDRAQKQGAKNQEEAPNRQGAQNRAPQVKVALGTIISAKLDRRKIILRPSTEVQGGERMIFKVRDDAEISLNNQPAEMADVKEGQQAQIEYVVRNERNRARAVALISNGGGNGG